MLTCLSVHISSPKFPVHSCQLSLRLLGFLLSRGFRFITCFGIRFSSVFYTCLFHVRCLFISSTIVCVTCTFVTFRSFVTPSSLDLPTSLHQKSISVAFNICFVVFLIIHILQLYVMSYISLLLLQFVRLS